MSRTWWDRCVPNSTLEEATEEIGWMREDWQKLGEALGFNDHVDPEEMIAKAKALVANQNVPADSTLIAAWNVLTALGWEIPRGEHDVGRMMTCLIHVAENAERYRSTDLKKFVDSIKWHLAGSARMQYEELRKEIDGGSESMTHEDAVIAARKGAEALEVKVQPTGEWPEYLMIRDTGLHDDLGGGGQRIFTTAGRGYQKIKYIREDLASPIFDGGGP